MEIVNLLKNQPRIFGSYSQFIGDCNGNTLPEYSFIEPCYNDHPGPGGGQILASDQHPDHHVQEGERFIANTYNAIRRNKSFGKRPRCWSSMTSTAESTTTSCPACESDGKSAPADKTGTGAAFNLTALACACRHSCLALYSAGTVVPGTEDPNGRIFEHACIPGTVTNFFLKNYDQRTSREKIPTIFSRP